MEITPKQRTQMWLAGGVLAIIYFAPSIVGFVRQWMFYRQQTAIPVSLPDPRRRPPHSGPSLPGTAGTPQDPSAIDPGSNSSVSIQPDNLLGTWQGAAPLPGNAMCMLKFELRTNTQAPGSYSGFPVLACMPLMAGFVRRGTSSPSPILNQMSPISAVLSGIAKDGTLTFTVEKTIQKSANGCALTGFTLTPFGTDQLAADWQEGTCQGGQMLLKKIGK